MNPEETPKEPVEPEHWNDEDQRNTTKDGVGGITMPFSKGGWHTGVGNGKEGSNVGETDGTSVGGNASPK
jgi:hypothetical protein